MEKVRKIPAKRLLFVKEYLADENLNASAAYKRAGYTAKNDNVASTEAARLLRNPEIAALIKVEMDKRADRLDIKADEVLGRWWDLARANVNEVVEYRRTCCRWCHGMAHKYQFTAGEIEAAETAAQMDKKEFTPPPGGGGFNATLDPHPHCPECHGEGIGMPHFKDSRTFSAQALLLYEGVKMTKNGIEVKTSNRQHALDRVAEHIGMLVKRTELTGKGGAALVPAGATGVLVVPGQIADMAEWEKLAKGAASPAPPAPDEK